MIQAEIKLNPSARAQTQAIGTAGECVVIDDFLSDPQSLIDCALACADEFEIPPRSYPGHVLSVAPDAAAPLRRFVKSQMSKHFPFLRGGLNLTTLMSVTTLKPEQLSNLQRLCHSDPRTSADRVNYAAVLYLFRDETLGGTAFYRWKRREMIEQATVLEQEDPGAALAYLQQHFPSFGEAPAYLTESNEIAELLHVVPARFNRWVFYCGDIPHSAYITSPEKLTTDFSNGRLTLNCFASTVPRR